MTDARVELLDRALVEEAAKKSGLLWVRIADASDRALWQVWHDGAVLVVGEGAEQPLHGLADGQTTVLTARSKDKWGRLVAWPVRVEELAPGSEAWTAAVAELKAKRLNSPDHETVTERWARESRVLRLVPTGGSVQNPDAMPDASHAAAPLPTVATTRRPAPAALPRLLFGRRRRRS
ncbi:hypothetical protein ABIA33_001270 [Streptacidiphilus sp. MAP12-16]|uniref:hypothetical protein n=1 Tax=Streptacidiphilus sp. MAP12-16 TaxID=3156300 RepID=UPI003518B907